MSVKFQVVERNNPQNLSLPKKYYAAAIADGEVDFDAMVEQVAYECSANEPDCYAVLLALVRVISKQLEQGRIVKLDKLGNFQVSLSSEGRESADQVNADAITKSRIVFRPAKNIRKLLSDLTYHKAS